MSRAAADPALLGHYTVAVFPFRHDRACFLTPDLRLPQLDARWAPWSARLADEDLASTLEATGFFLPYIRGLLYPEVARLHDETPTEDPLVWAARARRWASSGLAAYARAMPDHGVLRLTARDALAAALGPFGVADRPGDEPDLGARFDWVDVVLFPSGIGFVQLKATLTGDAPRLSQLIRLEHALRQVQPVSRECPLPVLHFAGAVLSLRALLADLVRGFAADWDVPAEERGLFPGPAGPDEVPYPDTRDGRALGERCHLLTFACADLASLPPQEFPAGEFASGTDRALFELAACVPLGASVDNPVWVPSQEQVGRLVRENQVRLWRCWSGLVLKEAVVFLGSEDLAFNRRSLPRRVEAEYLPLYLYALYQKFQLFTFSTDLLREVARSPLGHLAGARALLQRFVDFRARYWFDEVTRKPQGGELYRLFQQGLGVPGLYALVTSSVKEVKEYHEGVWARQVQWVRDVLTYGGPATVAFGTARMFLGDAQSGWTAGGLLAALVVAAGVLLAGLRRGRGPWRWVRQAPPALAGRLSRQFALSRVLGRVRSGFVRKR